MDAAPENPFDSPAQTAPAAGVPKTSGLAITSLVLGILSFFFALLTSLPAIICGIIALMKINRSQGALQGQGLAIGGIVTGGVGTVLTAGCLVALLLPAVQAAREAARTNMSMNQMKMMSLGMLNYESVKGAFPPSGAEGAADGSQLSWRVHILPYIEHGALYDQFHLDEPWDSPHNQSLLPYMPEVYRSPASDASADHTVYLAVTGPGTAFGDGSVRTTFRDITDGVTNTLMFVEADDSEAVPWTKPADWSPSPGDPTAGLGNQRAFGWLAAFFDGHVEKIDETIGPQTVSAMSTASGGETIQNW